MYYDKYQVYTLWKRLNKIWGMKRFNTVTTTELLETDLDDLLINVFIADNPRVEYISNYAINIVNEIRCGIVSLRNWAIMVIAKAMYEGKFPTLKDCSKTSTLKQFAIFNNREEVDGQIKLINALTAQTNSGLNEFSNKKFTLYELDENKENNAYKLFKERKISPIFFIKGLGAHKFEINENDVKEYEYKRFIIFSKIILKLYSEVKNAN